MSTRSFRHRGGATAALQLLPTIQKRLTMSAHIKALPCTPFGVFVAEVIAGVSIENNNNKMTPADCEALWRALCLEQRQGYIQKSRENIQKRHQWEALHRRSQTSEMKMYRRAAAEASSFAILGNSQQEQQEQQHVYDLTRKRTSASIDADALRRKAQQDLFEFDRLFEKHSRGGGGGGKRIKDKKCENENDIKTSNGRPSINVDDVAFELWVSSVQDKYQKLSHQLQSRK
eukprot:PhM_4_TR72/c0_g1_i1/m.42103